MLTPMLPSAIVLLSGGQDSSTCLLWAAKNFEEVFTVGFDYNQRHKVELACRANVIAETKAILGPADNIKEDFVISAHGISDLKQVPLASETINLLDSLKFSHTFVPGRNLIFMSLAGALAFRLGVRHLVTGTCETDYSGYPDCRDTALKSMQVAINESMGSNACIHTPLMWINKADTWQMALDLGGRAFLEVMRSNTHTCYMGTRDTLHKWGYGCGECPACVLRKNGYNEWISR